MAEREEKQETRRRTAKGKIGKHRIMVDVEKKRELNWAQKHSQQKNMLPEGFKNLLNISYHITE